MSERQGDRSAARIEEPEGDAADLRQPWVEPRLEFVEPQLVKQGEMRQITGFIGTFVPED